MIKQEEIILRNGMFSRWNKEYRYKGTPNLILKKRN